MPSIGLMREARYLASKSYSMPQSKVVRRVSWCKQEKEERHLRLRSMRQASPIIPVSSFISSTCFPIAFVAGSHMLLKAQLVAVIDL